MFPTPERVPEAPAIFGQGDTPIRETERVYRRGSCIILSFSGSKIKVIT